MHFRGKGAERRGGAHDRHGLPVQRGIARALDHVDGINVVAVAVVAELAEPVDVDHQDQLAVQRLAVALGEIARAARLDLAAQAVVILGVVHALGAGRGQLHALGALGVLLQVAADLGLQPRHLGHGGAVVLAARGGRLLLFARLHGLAAHARRGLARLRHQPALLFFQLLDAALRQPHQVAILGLGLRRQRRGGALGVMVAAAVQVGLGQHRRVARPLGGLGIDQHHVKLRIGPLDLEDLGRGNPHHQEQRVNDHRHGQRLGQRAAGMPPLQGMAGSNKNGVHDGGGRRVRAGQTVKTKGGHPTAGGVGRIRLRL
ncbi:hypothetical protein D3C81_1302190 [compost metagenome]